MTYGKIYFDADERLLVEELLQTALIKNAALQAAAQEDNEASFYRGVRPVLQSVLDAVQHGVDKVPLSEEQLRILKGLLSASFTELRTSYQEATETRSLDRDDLGRQWVIRDGLSTKLEAPFTADTSCDAEEGLFEQE